MEDRLQIIFYRHGKELDGWAENIRFHQERFIIPYNPYWEDARIKPMDIETLLYRLLVIFSGFGGFRGTWKLQQTLDYGMGLRTGISCERIDHHYYLGVDKDSIFLESSISHPECVHKMFDLFIQEIAAYSKLGIFGYSETELFDESVTKAYHPLLKRKIKGELPDFLRNYFIALAEFKGDFDLGVLQIRWPLNQFSMHKVLEEGCMAFEILHRLNVELWKKSNSKKPGSSVISN